MTDLRARASDLKDLPTFALLEQALELSHKDSEWENRDLVVAILSVRGDAETFAAAKNWCASTDVRERELAADLLNQFGKSVPNFESGREIFLSADQTVPLLEKLVDDPEAPVIASAVHGLGWHSVYDIILARPSLFEHSSSNVRFAVACSLAGSESKAAIDILIALSGDEDDDVRDRANWALQGSNIDTPEIREALVRNLSDGQTVTRCEAMAGLARRKDARVIPHIKKELAADSVFYIAIEAAGHMASADLAKSLEDLRSRSDEDRELLDRALNRCKGIFDPNDDEHWVEEGEIIVPPWATDETES